MYFVLRKYGGKNQAGPQTTEEIENSVHAPAREAPVLPLRNQMEQRELMLSKECHWDRPDEVASFAPTTFGSDAVPAKPAANTASVSRVWHKSRGNQRASQTNSILYAKLRVHADHARRRISALWRRCFPFGTNARGLRRACVVRREGVVVRKNVSSRRIIRFGAELARQVGGPDFRGDDVRTDGMIFFAAGVASVVYAPLARIYFACNESPFEVCTGFVCTVVCFPATM